MRAFDYGILRVVPRVERGEQLNVGVIAHCPTAGWLGARIQLDRARLLALDPTVDVEAVEQALEMVRRVAEADPAAGELATLTRSERFHWLTSPRSTMVQCSAVHVGLCHDPQAALDDLFRRLVLVPA